MIKINVISNNILWKKTLKNPQSYFDNKLKKINLNNDLFRKKRLVVKMLKGTFIIWQFFAISACEVFIYSIYLLTIL